MKKFLLLFWLIPALAFAQSSPNWPLGYKPSMPEWNAEFASKQDIVKGTVQTVTGFKFSDLIGHFATVTLEFQNFSAFAAFKPSAITTALAWSGAPVVAHTAGYYTPGDGGSATYTWNYTSGATVDGLYVITPGGGSSGRWILEAPAAGASLKQLGVHIDGVTSDDIYLKAALAACSTYGTRVVHPGGVLLLTGAGGSSSVLTNCTLAGQGFSTGSLTTGINHLNGALIELTSVTTKPFIVANNFGLDGISFYWPNQTGAVVYPALFGTSGSTPAGPGFIHHVTIVNAYVGFDTSSAGGNSWEISDSSLYAVNDLFKLGNTGNSWRFSNIDFSHAAWVTLVGYATAYAYVNAADQTNTIIHVPSGSGVTVTMDSTTTFAWRYGIKVDNGGTFGLSYISGAWDGVATVLDTSAGGCATGTTFTGSGWASYIPVFDSSGGVSGMGNVPTFNLGASTGNCHGPLLRQLQFNGPNAGSLMVSAGQEIDMDGVVSGFGSANDGNDYYAAHMTANGGGGFIWVKNSRFTGANTTKMHGIKNDVGVFNLIAKSNIFYNMNDAFDIDATTSPVQITTIQDNDVTSTVGAVSAVVTGSGPITWTGNSMDKPIQSLVSTCGSGASIFGGLIGIAHVGTGSGSVTSCTITLPFVSIFPNCQFLSAENNYIWLSGVSGKSYTVTASTNMDGSQIYYNCTGAQ